jgi:HAD superfamily hydrolase (TIGR01458 family)
VDPVRAVLFDIDGVLTVSWRSIAGAPEAVQAVRGAGLPVRFLTNTTSRPQAEIVRALRDAGFDVHGDEVLTTPLATVAHLEANHPGARCLLISEGDLGEDLAALTLVDDPTDADVVVLGGAGPAFSYEHLDQAFTAILDGAPVVAMHRNTTWKTDRGLQLDTGAWVVGLEHAARQASTPLEVTVVGKPAAAMFEAAIGQLGVTAGETAMVGDDLENDVHGAQAAGLQGVLVRTGKWRADPNPDQQAPDAVIDSVADLASLLDLA